MIKSRKVYQHPSAWKASELSSKASISECFSATELEALDQALQHIKKNNIELEAITRDDFPLPSISASVARWIDTIQEGRGLLLLSGFPIEEYSKADCEIIFYGLGSYLGEAQAQSAMGDKLGHVVNIGGKNTRERAYRNSVELALHTDASDIVAMMCLVKAETGGMSGYCSGAAVYNYMLAQHPDLLEILFEGFQYHLFDDFNAGETPVTAEKIPVFSEANDYLSVSYLRSYIELAFTELKHEKTEQESKALDIFDEIAHSPDFRLNFMMEPGDIVFFNNYVVLHTRDEFFDSDVPELKRHLLRLWLKTRECRPLVDIIRAYRQRNFSKNRDSTQAYYSGESQYEEVLQPVPRHQKATAGSK